jgi:hypothetical protein
MIRIRMMCMSSEDERYIASGFPSLGASARGDLAFIL